MTETRRSKDLAMLDLLEAIHRSIEAGGAEVLAEVRGLREELHQWVLDLAADRQRAAEDDTKSG